MFKNHPRGLLAAALANMGERFGFYTMMAILALFLQAKFGLSPTNAGLIYSIFYFSIYILAFVGGLIADRTRKYKSTILIGIIVMAVGYFLIAIPTPTPVPNFVLYLSLSCLGLLVIAFGNGLFKGNLQALVGQMYDDPKYKDYRDSGFSLFYMFINVGALFSPLFAVAMRNAWLSKFGYAYDANLPALCHQQINGTLETTKVMGTGVLDQAQLMAEKVFALDPISKFQAFANEATKNTVSDLSEFARSYVDVFNTGFHLAFGIAVIAMMISLVIYIVNKKRFPNPSVITRKTSVSDTELQINLKEIKQRLYALFAVFGIVIFFWFSFHQNGLTLTFFAKDYTNLSLIKINLGFIEIKGAEIFQSINPLFIVLLTPLVMALFGWLKKRKKEPSTPKKIAIGMGIAALAYVVMAVGSFDLPLFESIKSNPLDDGIKVTPFLLITTYFILTVAELFISPLGIAFVTKVAPPQYQGVMQGGWLGATAIGNQLLFIGAIFYENIPIWLTWSVFVTVCLISMTTMLLMLKWLEKITK